MLLKQIRLKNFRQYYDNVEIRFACDPEKNVTVIHAENGVGKTALLNAIKWCFYGDFTQNFRNPSDLVNFSAKEEGKNSCSVEIEFDNDHDSFLIIRRYNERVGAKGKLEGEAKVYKLIDGTWSGEIPEPELVINGMLPKEMADYFFFQGEGSNAVETGNRGFNLASSIRNILGFKVAESVQALLQKKSASITRRIAALDTSGAAQKVAAELEQIGDDKKDLEDGVRKLQELIPDLEFHLDMINSELGKINNADLYDLRKEEQELEGRLKKLSFDLRSANSRKYEVAGKYGWAVFGREFANESLEFIDESTLKGRLPEPYNKTFVEDILAQARCICGGDLKNGSEAYLNVVKLLEKAANPALQSRLGAVRAQIQQIATLNDISRTAVNDALHLAKTLEEQQQIARNRLGLVSEKIRDIPEDLIQELQNKKIKVDQDLGNQRQRLGAYISRLEIASKKFEAKKQELEKLTPNTKDIEGLNSYKQYVEDLLSELTKHLNITESSVRAHVAKKVNDMMRSFSRHSYEIRISEKDFSIHLVTTDGTPVGQGDGLNLLLNLSITAALIEFVKERQKIRDPLLTSATAAPLVIDAPFGVLDDSYRNVVVKSLPEHVEQVMFFVSSSQWREEMNDVIKDRVGAEYCLILEEKMPQGDRTLDIFNIRGKQIVASRYGCERDRVLAQEVAV